MTDGISFCESFFGSQPPAEPFGVSRAFAFRGQGGEVALDALLKEDHAGFSSKIGDFMDYLTCSP